MRVVVKIVSFLIDTAGFEDSGFDAEYLMTQPATFCQQPRRIGYQNFALLINQEGTSEVGQLHYTAPFELPATFRPFAPAIILAATLAMERCRTAILNSWLQHGG